MHVEAYGSGPSRFFALHGWSGDHRTFTPLLNHLPEGAAFFAADLPGCGASPAPSQWTIQAVAQEIAQAILKLDAPVTLIGNCSGANISLFVAQLIPHSIERIVMIDAFAQWPWYFRVFVNRAFGRYAYFSTFENPLGRWITNQSLSNKRQQDTSLTDGFTRVDHRTTYRYLTMLRDSGDAEQFRHLAMPIDIAYGKRSFAEVATSAAIFAAMWPQAKVTCFPFAGHLPILEATSALSDLIFQSKGSACTTQTASYAN